MSGEESRYSGEHPGEVLLLLLIDRQQLDVNRKRRQALAANQKQFSCFTVVFNDGRA